MADDRRKYDPARGGVHRPAPPPEIQQPAFVAESRSVMRDTNLDGAALELAIGDTEKAGFNSDGLTTRASLF